MKEYKAKLSYLRISPRKTRLVADLVRGLDVPNARYQLQFMPKRSSLPILKLLNSAVSNAKNIDEGIDEKNLFIKKITVDQGPMLKRYMPVARGGVHEIQKKTSHVILVLGEKKETKKKETAKKEVKGDTKSKQTKKVTAKK